MSSNRITAQRFEQAHDAQIMKMFWVAGSLNNKDLKYYLEDLSEKDLIELIPKFGINNYLTEYKDDLIQALIDFGTLGFIAEINIPIPTNIRFDEKGNLKGYGASHGYCEQHVLYGETTSDLLKNIEKKANEMHQRRISKAKSEIKN